MKNKKQPLQRTEIKAALDAALAGSRKLKLTFNGNAFVDILYLLGMNEKIVQMPEMAYMNLYAVAASKSWDGVPRDVTITLLAGFNEVAEDWFLGRMNDRALAAIAVA